MWVGTFIGAVVMHAMNCYPPRRRIFKTADRKASKGMFQPQRALEASMAEQPVIAKIDPQSTEDENSKPSKRKTCPTEEPGAKGQKCQQVAASDRTRVAPIDLPVRHADRKQRVIALQ